MSISLVPQAGTHISATPTAPQSATRQKALLLATAVAALASVTPLAAQQTHGTTHKTHSTSKASSKSANASSAKRHTKPSPKASTKGRVTAHSTSRSTSHTVSVSHTAAHAISPARSPLAASRPESTYLGIQVDTLAEPNPVTFVPHYPPALKARGVPGTVVAQFVVDTTGRVDMGTFKVLSSTDTAFTRSVRTAVARTDFLPALLDGRKVRQLYEQPFTFAVDAVARPTARDTTAMRPAPAAGTPP